jgi:hypothetical protein
MILKIMLFISFRINWKKILKLFVHLIVIKKCLLLEKIMGKKCINFISFILI